MGESKNPEGTARVTDEQLINRLKELHKDEPEKLAFGASEVAESLPIKRQAARKRLDRLAQTDSEIERYKATRAWHYFIPGLNKWTEPVYAGSPATVIEHGRERANVKILSWLFRRPEAWVKNWYYSEQPKQDLRMLSHYLIVLSIGVLFFSLMSEYLIDSVDFVFVGFLSVTLMFGALLADLIAGKWELTR